MTEPIYHLAEPRDWAASTDEYRTAGLDGEGFIHCSTGDQLSKTAREIFPRRNNLILLTIDSDALADRVAYEDLYEQGEEFPHVYGPLPTSAVMTTGPYLTHLEEGLWLDTRFDHEWMATMLHPDFSEVGASGQPRSRDDVLGVERVDLEVELPLEGCRMDLVDEDVALVRYVSRITIDGEEQTAERSSIWVNTNEGWRLRFHQGTPLR